MKGVGHSIVAKESKAEPDAKQESIKQDQNQLELDFQEISLFSSTNCKLTNGWYIDSTASRYITFNKDLIFDFHSQCKKFDQKSLKAIFVGYPQGAKG